MPGAAPGPRLLGASLWAPLPARSPRPRVDGRRTLRGAGRGSAPPPPSRRARARRASSLSPIGSGGVLTAALENRSIGVFWSLTSFSPQVLFIFRVHRPVLRTENGPARVLRCFKRPV